MVYAHVNRSVLSDNGRRFSYPSGPKLPTQLAIQIQSVKISIHRGKVQALVPVNRRRRDDGSASLVFPFFLPFSIQRIKLFIMRAEINLSIAPDRGGGHYLATRLEFPFFRTVRP